MKELTEILKKCDRPYIVCGDFNIHKGVDEIKDFIQKNKTVRSCWKGPVICS